jgi:alpha-glucosidase
LTDFGYDISDYTAIDPIFGTLVDFDALVDGARRNDIKIILDLVPNHTSDRHPWFLESRTARDSAKRDWYIWRDPAPDGGPPNNWLSEFGGSAWQLDEATGQYYCHTFLAAQPDLNWRNPQVRAAIYEVMRFWLKRGVSGFRVDVIWHLIKDDQLRDNPKNPAFTAEEPPHHAVVPLYTADRPEIHDVIREMRNVIEEFDNRVLIGEVYLPVERLVAYYGRDLRGLHLPFNFALLSANWQARTVARLVDHYEAVLPPGGWPNWVLGNHDRPRVASRLGEPQARCAAMLLLTLRGTPTIYYGDEIGMQQARIAPEDVQDPFEKRVPGKGLGRDGCRTPMQWDDGPQAGFSLVKPWLPIRFDYQKRNVATLTKDRKSILQLYRRLIDLRRHHTALRRGSYKPVAADGDLLLFLRQDGTERILAAINMGRRPSSVSFDGGVLGGELLLSTFCDRWREHVHGSVELRPDEGILIELSEDAAPPI